MSSCKLNHKIKQTFQASSDGSFGFSREFNTRKIGFGYEIHQIVES